MFVPENLTIRSRAFSVVYIRGIQPGVREDILGGT
jgi:hypothetical protein